MKRAASIPKSPSDATGAATGARAISGSRKGCNRSGKAHSRPSGTDNAPHLGAKLIGEGLHDFQRSRFLKVKLPRPVALPSKKGGESTGTKRGRGTISRYTLMISGKLYAVNLQSH